MSYTRCCLLGLFIGLPASAGEPVRLDPDLPYQARKANPITYDVDYSIVITPPAHSRVLKVWLPLPPSNAGQEVTEKSLTTFPLKVEPRVAKEKVFDNTFAYFEFDHPEGAQIIRHTFTIRIWELHWDVDPQRVKQIETWPAGFDRYLRAEHQAVVINDRVRELAREISRGNKDAGRNLALVMDWVNDHMKYDHARASLQASAEHALAGQTGHCSDYHGLCASLGRALGYPTRITYGINPFPKNSPSHCKLEAFLPPYGWVSFDVSETQLLIAAITKDAQLESAKKDELIRAATQRLRRGFRDNTWFMQTRGTDYDLVPPASRKVPVVRTIYAEADGVALPDPDPANPTKREFAWMVVARFTPDRPAINPFKNLKSLEANPPR